MTDHCGHCGLPLQPAPLGGTLQCCAGRAYWTKAEPRPRDWWYRGVPAKYGSWWLYLNSLLPLDTIFIQPRSPDNGPAEPT